MSVICTCICTCMSKLVSRLIDELTSVCWERSYALKYREYWLPFLSLTLYLSLSLSLSLSPLSAVLSHSCSLVPPLWWGLSCWCWGLQRWSGCPQQSQDHIVTGTSATPGNGQTHAHNIDVDIHLAHIQTENNVSGLAYVQSIWRVI